VADWIRVRVQVQQRSLEVHQDGENACQRAVGYLHSQVSRRHPRDRQTLIN